MKKLPLIITICLVLLLVGGYFLYQRLNTAPLKAWDLVPADAVLVYEKDQCESCIEDVKKSSVWSLIENALVYKRPADSILSKVTSAISRTSGVLISAHVTRKDDFDVIYYIPTSKDFISLKDVPGFRSHSVSSRAFSGVTLYEIHFGKQVFSFAQIEGVWVGSFTSFLVEDVIRSFRNHEEAGKQSAFGSLQFASIKDDAGNLYVRLESLQELLSIFVNEAGPGYLFGRSAMLDIKSDESTLTLNGFSTDSIDRAKYFLSVFKHQNPVSFGMKNLISNRVIAVAGFGVSDGKKFSTDLQEFVRVKKPNLRDSLGRLSVDIAGLHSKIDDEVAVCFLEGGGRSSLSKVLLIETRDAKPWLRSFHALGDKLSVDTVFYERYSQYELREIPLHKFSEKFLWPLVTGFEHNYYTSIGNVVIVAEDIEDLKRYLDDIDADETWGRSVSQNRFLESTLLESNVSLYVNTSRFLSVYASNLQPRWQSFLKENRSLVQSMQMTSLQFSHLNNSYYTNALFSFRPVKGSGDTPKRATGGVTVFNQGVLGLAAVRSHVNRANEVLVQDSLNNLSLVSADGKILWSVAIGEKITGEIVQVDFFNNGKLQYFFAGEYSLHVIDRLGNYVKPFPLTITPADISHVSIVDYDNSKKYRFLVAGKSGKISMYDKDGNLLEGWNPKDAGGALTTAAKHYRIKGKDYVVACRTDGVVYLWTRRGELIDNFPVDLHAQPVGDFFLERGNTLDDTYFVFITRDGFRIRVTPEGKIQSKETLLRTSIRSTFSLTSEKSGKSYLIVQQDERQITVSDADGKKLVSTSVIGTVHGDVKYYDYGSGKIFVTIRDKAQGLYYVFDGQGNLLTTPPIETSHLEIRPRDSDEFTLFFIHGRTLVTQSL